MNTADVAAVIPTRGDIDLNPILDTLPFPTRIWDNSSEADDLSVFGRYAAIEHTHAPIIWTQDDDAVLPRESIRSLLDSYRPGAITANMPAEYRERYPDTALVGFGAIFDRDLPQEAFAMFRERHPLTDNGFFLRTCDLVFATLTPLVLVDLPFEMLPHTRAANRMYRQPGNTEERHRMLALAREVRDAM